MKKLEYKKENLRLLAHLVAKASSGTLFTKMLNDGGWSPLISASEEYQKAGKSKEDYLFCEFEKIAEQGRFDILDFIVEKTVRKDRIYFKIGEKEYKFPKEPFSDFKKKLRVKKDIPQKKNEKIFDERKFHNSVNFASKNLFRDGHYSQAIFESCKLLNKRVQELSKLETDGKSLMLSAFSVNNPKLKFNALINQSDKDEQEGFMHIFAGVMHGIRNPKGHEITNLKDPFRALEYLSLISLLFKKLDELK